MTERRRYFMEIFMGVFSLWRIWSLAILTLSFDPMRQEASLESFKDKENVWMSRFKSHKSFGMTGNHFILFLLLLFANMIGIHFKSLNAANGGSTDC